MNLLTTILSGFREIRAHWFRSALTMFGVICGVASLVTMAAFVKGKENLLRESLAQSGGLERITVESEDDLPDYQKHLEDEIRGITLKDVYALRNNAPLVYNVTPISPTLVFSLVNSVVFVISHTSVHVNLRLILLPPVEL